MLYLKEMYMFRFYFFVIFFVLTKTQHLDTCLLLLFKR